MAGLVVFGAMETVAMPKVKTKSKRAPLRKSKLPPPVPEVRRLPRPTDFNFTSDDVVTPLVEGGWNIERSLAETLMEAPAISLFVTPLAINDPRQKLDRDIKAAVADYVADVAQRRGRPACRRRNFAPDFPNSGSTSPSCWTFRTRMAAPMMLPDDAAAAAELAIDRALIDAVSIKLETQDRTSPLDIEQSAMLCMPCWRRSTTRAPMKASNCTAPLMCW